MIAKITFQLATLNNVLGQPQPRKLPQEDQLCE